MGARCRTEPPPTSASVASAGVERVGAVGDLFDPNQHEAVIYQERLEAREQRVWRVLRPGYRAGSELVRPAQVVVAGPIRPL